MKRATVAAGNQPTVLDARGKKLSPCSEDRAHKLLRSGKATVVSEEPLVIRLKRAIDIPPRPAQETEANVLEGKRVLLHICCGPCATYTVKRLVEQGAIVTGYWFNPNIHPYSEHERRRETLAHYAEEIGLPVIWEPGYEMPAFFRAVVGHVRFRERKSARCPICYRMRLERTARVAADCGFDLFTTTLLISPYQDQEAIQHIGDALGHTHDATAFYFENFRRGFAEHHRLAKEHDLYVQRYCGCLYSEWEAQDRQAFTHPRD